MIDCTFSSSLIKKGINLDRKGTEPKLVQKENNFEPLSDSIVFKEVSNISDDSCIGIKNEIEKNIKSCKYMIGRKCNNNKNDHLLNCAKNYDSEKKGMTFMYLVNRCNLDDENNYDKKYHSVNNDNITQNSNNITTEISAVPPPAASPPTVSPPVVSSLAVLPSAVSPSAVSPSAVSPSAVSPLAVSPLAVSPSAVSPSAVSPLAVSPLAVSPSAVLPSAVSPSAVSPSAVSPSAVLPSAVSLSAVSPSAVSPSAVSPSAVLPSAVSPSAVSPSAVSPSSVSLPAALPLPLSPHLFSVSSNSTFSSSLNAPRSLSSSLIDSHFVRKVAAKSKFSNVPRNDNFINCVKQSTVFCCNDGKIAPAYSSTKNKIDNKGNNYSFISSSCPVTSVSSILSFYRSTSSSLWSTFQPLNLSAVSRKDSFSSLSIHGNPKQIPRRTKKQRQIVLLNEGEDPRKLLKEKKKADNLIREGKSGLGDVSNRNCSSNKNECSIDHSSYNNNNEYINKKNNDSYITEDIFINKNNGYADPHISSDATIDEENYINETNEANIKEESNNSNSNNETNDTNSSCNINNNDNAPNFNENNNNSDSKIHAEKTIKSQKQEKGKNDLKELFSQCNSIYNFLDNYVYIKKRRVSLDKYNNNITKYEKGKDLPKKKEDINVKTNKLENDKSIQKEKQSTDKKKKKKKRNRSSIHLALRMNKKKKRKKHNLRNNHQCKKKELDNLLRLCYKLSNNENRYDDEYEGITYVNLEARVVEKNETIKNSEKNEQTKEEYQDEKNDEKIRKHSYLDSSSVYYLNYVIKLLKFFFLLYNNPCIIQMTAKRNYDVICGTCANIICNNFSNTCGNIYNKNVSTSTCNYESSFHYKALNNDSNKSRPECQLSCLNFYGKLLSYLGGRTIALSVPFSVLKFFFEEFCTLYKATFNNNLLVYNKNKHNFVKELFVWFFKLFIDEYSSSDFFLFLNRTNRENIYEMTNRNKICEIHEGENIYGITIRENICEITDREKICKIDNVKNIYEITNGENIWEITNRKKIYEISNGKNIYEITNEQNICEVANLKSVCEISTQQLEETEKEHVPFNEITDKCKSKNETENKLLNENFVQQSNDSITTKKTNKIIKNAMFLKPIKKCSVYDEKNNIKYTKIYYINEEVEGKYKKRVYFVQKHNVFFTQFQHPKSSKIIKTKSFNVKILGYKNAKISAINFNVHDVEDYEFKRYLYETKNKFGENGYKRINGKAKNIKTLLSSDKGEVKRIFNNEDEINVKNEEKNIYKKSIVLVRHKNRLKKNSRIDEDENTSSFPKKKKLKITTGSMKVIQTEETPKKENNKKKNENSYYTLTKNDLLAHKEVQLNKKEKIIYSPWSCYRNYYDYVRIDNSNIVGLNNTNIVNDDNEHYVYLPYDHNVELKKQKNSYQYNNNNENYKNYGEVFNTQKFDQNTAKIVNVQTEMRGSLGEVVLTFLNECKINYASDAELKNNNSNIGGRNINSINAIVNNGDDSFWFSSNTNDNTNGVYDRFFFDKRKNCCYSDSSEINATDYMKQTNKHYSGQKIIHKTMNVYVPPEEKRTVMYKKEGISLSQNALNSIKKAEEAFRWVNSIN